MNTIPVFSSPWWLQATAGDDNWGFCEVNQNGHTLALMPWAITRRFGFKTIYQPVLTQTLGPWIADIPPGSKYSSRLGREQYLMDALIDQLPHYHLFRANFSPEITNWLPFTGRVFSKPPDILIVFLIYPILSCFGLVFKKMSEEKFGKAVKAGVVVERSSDIDTVFDLNELSFRRQKIGLPYTRSYLRRLFRACEANDAGAVFIARGKDGNVHSAIFLVWNEHCAYYLIGGSDPEYRNSGAMSLTMWRSIQFSASVSEIFDFEGSMIKPIERFFRGFGALQTPYFSITHAPSRRISSFLTLRSMIKSYF